MPRDYSKEHARRQQSKKRLVIEVPKDTWDALTGEQQALRYAAIRSAALGATAGTRPSTEKSPAKPVYVFGKV
jgi:hypothetical protein